MEIKQTWVPCCGTEGEGKPPRGLDSKAASAWVSGKTQCNLFHVQDK